MHLILLCLLYIEFSFSDGDVPSISQPKTRHQNHAILLFPYDHISPMDHFDILNPVKEIARGVNRFLISSAFSADFNSN